MDTVTITIKLPGQPPEVVKGLTSFSLICIPEQSPETNARFMSTGMTPKAIAECGAYMISLAKHMQTGTLSKMRPLGDLTVEEKRVVTPTAQGRTPSGLHLL